MYSNSKLKHVPESTNYFEYKYYFTILTLCCEVIYYWKQTFEKLFYQVHSVFRKKSDKVINRYKAIYWNMGNLSKEIFQENQVVLITSSHYLSISSKLLLYIVNSVG